MLTGYIYIAILREFIVLKSPIYKIGFTGDIIVRMSKYPKGSKVIFCQYVGSARSKEAQVLSHVRAAGFVNRPEIGREYFEGDISRLIGVVKQCIETRAEDLCGLDITTKRVEIGEGEPMDLG